MTGRRSLRSARSGSNLARYAKTRKEYFSLGPRDLDTEFEVKVTLNCSVNHFELVQISPDEYPEYGELRIYFTGYDQHQHPTLYPSDAYLKMFRTMLTNQGFSRAAARDADWSESGMQGQNYASFDVGKVFIAEWNRLLSE